MARVDDLAAALAVKMLDEAVLPVSVDGLALVMPEASALAQSVIAMEERIRQARHRIAELAAVSGAGGPWVAEFDPAGAAWSPASN